MKIFDEDLIDLDLKEDYNLGTDITCHQNDNIILNLVIRNNGKVVDLTNFNVELRVKKPDGTDYVQDVFGITKDTKGNVKIVCEDSLTTIEGKAKGEIRIWDNTYSQQTGRVLFFKIIPSVLSIDGKLHTSTITILNHLDMSMNKVEDLIKEANQVIEVLENDIADGKSTDKNLKSTIVEGKSLDITLKEDIKNGITTKSNLDNGINIANDKISNLDTRNNLASENCNKLDDRNTLAKENCNKLNDRNTLASEKIGLLDNKNDLASKNISSLDTKNALASENCDKLDSKNNLAKENCNNLDTKNALASEKITKIEQLNQLPDTIDLANLKKEVGDARTTFPTLNDRITEAENSGGFMMAKELPAIEERKSTILYMKILN